MTIPSSGTVHLVLAECPSLWKAHNLGELKVVVVYILLKCLSLCNLLYEK